MSDQQILNATISIEEIADKDKKISIKGNDGHRTSTFGVWKTKQDGTSSQAFSQFKNMNLKVGSTVMIGYVIDEYETEIGGFPKKIQSKKIINFRETSPQTAPHAKSSNGEANRGHSGDSKGETFWDKKAYKQCLWGQALAVGLHNFGSKDCDLVWNTFKSIEADANKRFSEPLDGANLDLPVIQQGEDLNVDDLPF